MLTEACQVPEPDPKRQIPLTTLGNLCKGPEGDQGGNKKTQRSQNEIGQPFLNHLI